MASLQENQAEVPAGSGKGCCYAPLMYCKLTSSVSVFPLEARCFGQRTSCAWQPTPILSSQVTFSLLKFMPRQLDIHSFSTVHYATSTMELFSLLYHKIMMHSRSLPAPYWVQWTLNNTHTKKPKPKSLKKAKPLTRNTAKMAFTFK